LFKAVIKIYFKMASIQTQEPLKVLSPKQKMDLATQKNPNKFISANVEKAESHRAKAAYIAQLSN
jgi:hypothetical protein